MITDLTIRFLLAASDLHINRKGSKKHFSAFGRKKTDGPDRLKLFARKNDNELSARGADRFWNVSVSGESFLLVSFFHVAEFVAREKPHVNVVISFLISCSNFFCQKPSLIFFSI